MRLKTFHVFALFRAVVIDIVVGIAVFLPFSACFARNHQTARTTAQQTTKDLWVVVFAFAWATTHSQDRLDLVKELFAHNRYMFALVQLAYIAEVSIVERVCQNMTDLVFFKWLAATGLYAVFGKESSNILKSLIAFGVSLKGCNDQRRTPLVYDYAFGAQVVNVAERGMARVFAPTNFLA
ncbi:MAG TPA: hypothetical protein PKA29_02500 [Candidatus Saccharibacteria bacterium]|nr:hypothetical protein [Candidatus Saccharibacteria bacterium]